jgi:hypothetical protein
MNKFFYLTFLFFGLVACQKREAEIISESINAHGGNNYDNLHLRFDFRGMAYELERDNGRYEYKRTQKDSLEALITDIISNDTFKRLINNEGVFVPDNMALKYQNSVNSVAYFFLLPFGLEDPAVNKAYEKEVVIKGNKYHQIRVWFNQEGGGTDHQDVFLFWINCETYRMEYLAYSYETDGGGVRFREAINGRMIGGLYLQDYNNYGYEDGKYPLDKLPQDLENGRLPFLSKIENENIH